MAGITTSLRVEENIREVLAASSVTYQDVFNYGLIYMGLNGGKDKKFLTLIKHIIEDRTEENKRLINNLNAVTAKIEGNGKEPAAGPIIDGDTGKKESSTENAIAWIKDPDNEAYSILALKGVICEISGYDHEKIKKLPRTAEDFIPYVNGADKSQYYKRIWLALNKRDDFSTILPMAFQKAEEFTREDK